MENSYKVIITIPLILAESETEAEIKARQAADLGYGYAKVELIYASIEP